MFRKDSTLADKIKILFNLSNDYIEEGTKSSLIAAFKLLSTIYEIQPEKAIQGRLGVVKTKLRHIGELDNVIRDENMKSQVKTNPDVNSTSRQSKL